MLSNPNAKLNCNCTVPLAPFFLLNLSQTLYNIVILVILQNIIVILAHSNNSRMYAYSYATTMNKSDITLVLSRRQNELWLYETISSFSYKIKVLFIGNFPPLKFILAQTISLEP